MAAMIADSNCIIPLSGQAERRIRADDEPANEYNASGQIHQFWRSQPARLFPVSAFRAPAGSAVRVWPMGAGVLMAVAGLGGFARACRISA
jgi:hypothetical protein